MVQLLVKSEVYCISFVNSLGFAFDRKKQDSVSNGQTFD